MKCRQCGTEIAEKALICFRCGTAVAEPAVKPHVPKKKRPVIVYVVFALIVIAAIAAMLLRKTLGF